MKQEEKTKRTRERILEAAIIEFGTNSFEEASITHMCKENNISKGLVYHNFENKDDLYLNCVEITYKRIIDYLKNQEIEITDIHSGIKNMMALRQTFFNNNPCYANIFYNTVIKPQKHLILEIQNIRKSFRVIHAEYFRKFFSSLKLRDSITVDIAIDLFLTYMEVFKGYLQNHAVVDDSDTDSNTENLNCHAGLVDSHEMRAAQMFDIFLYGIIER